MAEQSPDALEDYLQQWGLEVYFTQFKGKYLPNHFLSLSCGKLKLCQSGGKKA